MGSLLLNILFVSIGAAVGTVAGWFLRGGSAPVSDAQTLTADKEASQSMAHMETMVGRLHQLTSSVAADIGEHSHRVQEINHELELGGNVVTVMRQLVDANEKMQLQLQSAEKRLQSQAKEIESHAKEARTDALTRLGNRRAFDDELRHCVESQRTNDEPFCVMMVDVDHFKRVNDTFGHQAGDEVLKGVARVLRREFADREVVCRYGGEEFAIIFPGQTLEATIKRAELGRAAIGAELIEYDEMDLKVTVTAGIAESAPGEPGSQLVRRADGALYVGKANGRNCGYWHDGTTSLPIKNFTGRAAASSTSTSDGVSDGPPDPPPVTDVSQLENDEPAVSNTGRRDRIAGVSDRDTLYKDLERRLAEQQRRGTTASLLLLEIDNYAAIEDDYGDKTADMALRTTVRIIKASKRDMDHAARFGTASFAILVPGTDLSDALAVAERIRTGVADCNVPVYGEQLEFTVSVGVTVTQRGDELDTVVARLNEALQDARSAGGNRVRSVSPVQPLPAIPSPAH